MAYTQHIYLFLILLSLTACLELQFTEGRQLKVEKENELSSVNIDTAVVNQAKKKISPPITPTQSHEFSTSDVSRTDAFTPTTPGNSPGIGHSFAVQKHNMQTNVQDFSTVAGETDGTQHTTPGHSPGIGHSFAVQKHMQTNVQDFSTVAGKTDGTQHTTPGHSPGIGHSFAVQKHNMQYFTTVAGKTDGFQPTTPGHSPGIGHSIGNLKSGPNA
ncbi:hypothetical protein BUALT_Bualt04G0114000 [Buddleja alternifolia]|uniref:Uncharacterized protein n=1 Tax=Buddleja alternifolia TaxID=168488 RepID=A0AAV6XPE4_9LAMI|nr:hypothetical protein BUALT_Bualt04G0114000 [Buddleja alternifolia]